MAQDKIYIGGLSYNTTEEGLNTTFSQYGSIKDISLIIDRDTGRSKGFAFITFDAQQAAEASLDMNGKPLDGRTIKVNMAQDRKTGTGGSAGGRGRW